MQLQQKDKDRELLLQQNALELQQKEKDRELEYLKLQQEKELEIAKIQQLEESQNLEKEKLELDKKTKSFNLSKNISLVPQFIESDPEKYF